MDPSIVVAFIGFAGAVVVAWFTARTETVRIMAQVQVKVDLLWRVYVEDAVKEARAAGLAEKNSPARLTGHWYDLLDEPLKSALLKDLRYYLRRLGSAYDAAIETYGSNQTALRALAEARDLRQQAIIGGLYLWAVQIQESS